MDLKPWQKVNSKPAGDFRIFTIRSDRVISPRTSQTHEVVVIDCGNWVNVIATTPDQRQIDRRPRMKTLQGQVVLLGPRLYAPYRVLSSASRTVDYGCEERP